MNLFGIFGRTCFVVLKSPNRFVYYYNSVPVRYGLFNNLKLFLKYFMGIPKIDIFIILYQLWFTNTNKAIHSIFLNKTNSLNDRIVRFIAVRSSVPMTNNHPSNFIFFKFICIKIIIIIIFIFLCVIVLIFIFNFYALST